MNCPTATTRPTEHELAPLPDAAHLRELMQEAAARVSTVYAELREWSHPGRTMEAWARRTLGGAESLGGVAPAAPYEVVTKCWIQLPDRFREEGPDHVIVQAGDRWYTRHPALGVATNEDDPDRTITVADTLRHWIDPAPVFPLLSLSVEGEGSVAGRRALRGRAVPADGSGDDPELAWLGLCADEWELLVDAERGVILATTARVNGEPFRIGEALRITFDEAFDESLFAVPA